MNVHFKTHSSRFIGEARNRPEFKSMKSADISRECGKLWRDMSDAEKDVSLLNLLPPLLS